VNSTPSPDLSPLVKGDDAAWASFYDSIAGDLRAYIVRIGARDPDDVLGETMVQLVRDVKRFEGTYDELRPWAFRVARNRVSDAARRRTRRPDVMADLDDDQTPDPAPLETSPDLDRLSELLSGLTDDQREAVWLRHVLDLPLTTAAEIMDRDPGAVAALTMRAMRRLRQQLLES
jgi:RNA polymerase sigma-70 factor (ECF subfamily)